MTSTHAWVWIGAVAVSVGYVLGIRGRGAPPLEPTMPVVASSLAANEPAPPATLPEDPDEPLLRHHGHAGTRVPQGASPEEIERARMEEYQRSRALNAVREFIARCDSSEDDLAAVTRSPYLNPSGVPLAEDSARDLAELLRTFCGPYGGSLVRSQMERERALKELQAAGRFEVIGPSVVDSWTPGKARTISRESMSWNLPHGVTVTLQDLESTRRVEIRREDYPDLFSAVEGMLTLNGNAVEAARSFFETMSPGGKR